MAEQHDPGAFIDRLAHDLDIMSLPVATPEGIERARIWQQEVMERTAAYARSISLPAQGDPGDEWDERTARRAVNP